MLLTNTWMDKLDAAGWAFAELGMMDGMTSSYMAMVLSGEQPQPHMVAADDDNEDNDNGPIAGPKSFSSIELACLSGMFSPSFSFQWLNVSDSSAQGYPSSAEALTNCIHQSQFAHLLR
jgi:hypothetical protein